MNFKPLTFETILEHPTMYLPSRNIYCLKALVDGINCSDQTDVWDYLDGFYDWLNEVLNQHTSMPILDESKLILHFMSNDPYDAFDRFFELLEEFKEGEELMPLFKKLKAHPYDFIPQRTIHCLYAFLRGKDLTAQNMMKYVDLAAFERWIQQQFDNDSSWFKVIMHYSHDEYGALQQFVSLHEEFNMMPSHASDTESAY